MAPALLAAARAAGHRGGPSHSGHSDVSGSGHSAPPHNPQDDGEELDLDKHFIQSPIAQRSSITIGPGSSQRPSMVALSGHSNPGGRQSQVSAGAPAAAPAAVTAPVDPTAPVFLTVMGTPPVWAAYYSPPADKCYFYNLMTQVTTWECPADIAPAAAAAEADHRAKLKAAAAAAAAAAAPAPPAAAPAPVSASGFATTPAAAAAAAHAQNTRPSTASAPPPLGLQTPSQRASTTDAGAMGSPSRYTPAVAGKPLFRASVLDDQAGASTTATPGAAPAASPESEDATKLSPAPSYSGNAAAGEPPLHAEVAQSAPLPLAREGTVERLTTGLRKAFKPRFVLLADNALRYWDSQEEAGAHLDKPKGEGSVPGCVIHRPPHDAPAVRYGLTINAIQQVRFGCSL